MLMRGASRERARITSLLGALLVHALVWPAAPRALAEEWAILGPRAMGMGGAGVAVARGGLSSYWNPAALAPPRAPRLPTIWDLEVPATFYAGASNNFIGEVDDVADLVTDLDFDTLELVLDDPGTALSPAQLQNVLRLAVEELPDLGVSGTGVVSQASAGAAARVMQFGFSALGIAHAGGVTRLDDQNIALGDEGVDGAIGPGIDRTGQISAAGQSFADQLAADGLATQNQAEEIVFESEQAGISVANPANQARIRDILAATAANDGGGAGNSIIDNQSGVDLQGILVQEYALSFAQPLFGVVSVGASAKLMSGWTYFEPFDLQDLDGFEDDAGDLFDEENRDESLRFGVDAGVLFQPLPWLALGVTGRNLNNPGFDFKGPGDYVLERQFRAGVGFTPIPWLTLAADIDLLRNDCEALPGYHSQVLGGGVEFALFDAGFFRLGLSKNLAESKEDLVIHGGFGLRVWLLQIDAALAFATDWTEIETGDAGGDPTEVPERVGASLQIGLNVPLD
jgi:hypothetical protein